MSTLIKRVERLEARATAAHSDGDGFMPVTVEVRDPVLGRVIQVAKTGSSSTIVWNPWVDKSQRLIDFGDDEWQQMVCVETANVGAHCVTLGPGETHRMTATLSVRRPSGSR